ncbi:MAG: gamma-glutamyltransferase, partial [Planctomycetia bacterium]
HANELKPHKRPFHTIIPGMAFRDGRPWLSFGVMGGDMQPQGQAQVLMNMIDHGLTPQQSLDAPRVRHAGHATPRGEKMTAGGETMLEAGIHPETARLLESLGHRVAASPSSGFGGGQVIAVDYENGVLLGGSDPRKDGAAVGY